MVSLGFNVSPWCRGNYDHPLVPIVARYLCNIKHTCNHLAIQVSRPTCIMVVTYTTYTLSSLVSLCRCSSLCQVHILWTAVLNRAKITVWWETFEGENFHELVKIRFSRIKLSRIARFCRAKGRHAPNFVERKLSRTATKPRNSQKFSPSKVFRCTVPFFKW